MESTTEKVRDSARMSNVCLMEILQIKNGVKLSIKAEHFYAIGGHQYTDGSSPVNFKQDKVKEMNA